MLRDPVAGHRKQTIAPASCSGNARRRGSRTRRRSPPSRRASRRRRRARSAARSPCARGAPAVNSTPANRATALRQRRLVSAVGHGVRLQSQSIVESWSRRVLGLPRFVCSREIFRRARAAASAPRVVGEPFENLAASAALLERLDRPADALEFRRARVRAVPWDADAQIALAGAEIAAAQDRAAALERFNRVADSPEARYAVRVEAARAFASAGGRPGPARHRPRSMAEGDCRSDACGHSRPMFVAARLAARSGRRKQSARIGLLLAPSRSIRGRRHESAVFRAGLRRQAGGRDEAIQPILARSRSLVNLGLTTAARAQLEREIAEAYRQVDRRRTRSASSPSRSKGSPPPRASRSAAHRRDQRGDRRRAEMPGGSRRIGEALDQPQLVRPRTPPKIAVPAR